MDNRTNHTSSDQSITAPLSEESERIERLEKENRRLRIMMPLVFAMDFGRDSHSQATGRI